MNIKNITYAGNHGLDIVHPDGTKFVPPLPEEVNINLLTIVLVIDVINYVTAGRVKSKLAASEAAGRVLSGEKENLVIYKCFAYFHPHPLGRGVGRKQRNCACISPRGVEGQGDSYIAVCF